MKRLLPFLLLLTGCTPEIRLATGVFNYLWAVNLLQISVWVWGIMAISLLFLGYKTYSFWFVFLPGAGLGILSGVAIGQAISPDLSAILIGAGFGFFLGWIAWAILHSLTIWWLGTVLGVLLCAELMNSILGASDQTATLLGGIFLGLFVAYIYHRLAGLVAALIGAILLQHLLNLNWNIWLLAGAGFFIQWQIARARGEDVFRRANYQPKPSPAPNEPEDKPTRKFDIKDFDPNAEIQVYEE